MRRDPGRSLASWLLAGLALLAATELAFAGPDGTDNGGAPKSEDGAPSHFGGPTSVGGQLAHDEKSRKAVLDNTIESWLQPYFDFKQRLRAKHGLAFGIDYNAMLQLATASSGDDFAAGGVLRFFGRWELLGRGSKNTGSFVFKVENRHRLGTNIAPQQLGSEVGYAGVTATVFSDRGWILTNFFWNQNLGRVAFVAGILDTTDYVDTYSLVSPWTDFSNLAFSTDPTIPVPDQGLGAAIRALITENIYILGGIADRNGDPTDPAGSFENFFDTAEFFTNLEFGWIASMEQRFTDSIHLTAWHGDAQAVAQVSSGWGLAFSWNRLIDGMWEPFVRAGYSDGGGALYEMSISIGVGYHIRGRSDLVGLGLNWGRPATDVFGPGLSDQYTVELYYRLQLLPHVTVTPDVQLLINPALNPNENVIAMFGLRVRFDF